MTIRQRATAPVVGADIRPRRTTEDVIIDLRCRAALLAQTEVFRFGLVGVANTGIDLVTYFLLQLAGVPVVVANLISTSAGLSFSFIANRLFTFSARSRAGARRQALLFLVCTGVGLWLIQPLVILAVGRVLVDAGGLGDLRILIAKLGAIAIAMVWNWTLYNKVVFRAVTR